MLAKNYINYERVSKQGIAELMKDLSGMPCREYNTNKLEQGQLRKYWEKSYIMLAKTKFEFNKKYITGNQYQNVYCGIRHVIELGTGEYYVQLKCYSQQIDKKTDFSTYQLLNISEDWLSTKSFTKDDSDCFWMNWLEFSENFGRVFVSHYDDKLEYDLEKFSFKDSSKYAVNLEVSNTGPLHIEVNQLDKIYRDQTYKYADIRLYLISRYTPTEKQDLMRSTTTIGNTFSSANLMKAAMSTQTRTTVLEVDLKKGNYTLIVDSAVDISKFKPDFTLSVYYSKKVNLNMTVENNLIKKRAYLDMICATAIQNGTKEYLSESENVRRYTFNSEKLHLFVYVYTNNTDHKYSILDKLQIKGDYLCSLDIHNG